MPRTLVIAPQWIGDAVMTEPLMAALATQSHNLPSTLVVAALPWVAPIYRAMPNVTAVMELPFAHRRLDFLKRRALGQSLRGQFDRAVILPNSFKSAILPWFAGIPERIGYAGEARRWLLHRHIPNPARTQRGAMVEHYLALANLISSDHASLRPSLASPKNPRLVVDAQLVHDTLLAFNLTANGYTVLAPGAEYGNAKRWPLEHFSALSKQLVATGQLVVLLGSNKEAPLCEAIRAQAAHVPLNLAGRTDLSQAIALIAASRQVVSNDSGLMHIAAAFAKPQVAIFGSSNPHHTPPLNPLAHVLWLKDLQGLDCAPCYQRECPLTGSAHLRCLQDIFPEQVMAKLGPSFFTRSKAHGP